MASAPPILERRLTPPEKAKFDRMRDRLVAAAAAAGRAIRVCEATGDGPHRRILLGRGLISPPLFALPAIRFLEAEDVALASEFERALAAG